MPNLTKEQDAELRDYLAQILESELGKRQPLSCLAGFAHSNRSQAEVDEFIRRLRAEWE